jgi:diguanylate cyclase (GGDEF)-like protein
MRWLLFLRSRCAQLPAWAGYALLSLIPMALAPWLLTSEWAQSTTTAVLGSATAAICVWRYRRDPNRSLAWLCIGAGIALNAWGGIVEAIEEKVITTTALVTPADGLYLCLYPFVTIGLLLIVRTRYPGLGPAKLLDASVLTIGLGLLCWIVLIRPAAASAAGSDLDRIVTLAYPVGDLMLLAILARIIAAEGWRVPAVRLMLFALIGFLLGDSAWAFVNNNGWSTSDAVAALLSEPFLIAFVLLGAGALHRSADLLSVRAPDEGDRGPWLLLALLTAGSLVAPAVLLTEALSGRVADGIAIAVCATLVALLVAARVAHLLRRVQRQAASLRELTLADPLTGLPNRRALDAYLEDALARAARSQQPISVALIDLDHFKRFNDEYGHAAGDQLLKSAASAWTSQIRCTDMLARIGGEEFVLVLPDADLGNAEAVVAKLRAIMPLGETFSAGVARWDYNQLADELLRAADAALYAAKRGGRDRTALAAEALS